MNEIQRIDEIGVCKSCRVCGNQNLDFILSLGDQSLVNFVDSEKQKILTAPLELILCNPKNNGCGLLQLKHTVPSDVLFKKFWYKSGVNQTMKDALADIVNKASGLINLKEGDIVVDIGANDGTLLRSYNIRGLQLVGFEPATNLVKEAKVGTTMIINDFFNYEKFAESFANQKSKVITSIAMFYDLEEPNKFVSDIVKILDTEGIWIIQMNYLTTMLENNAFDNIVHEHLEYYSLSSLEHLLEKHNLSIFDIELNDINGGSLRTYIKHKECNKFPITKRVEEIRQYEKKLGLDNIEPYLEFARRINDLKKKTYDFIKNEVEHGKKVHVYGASTRGNTLLQFYDLDNKLIGAAVDRNPEKWGKRTVPTNIPIISEEQGRREKPDYFLILPWYFIKEFQSRENDYLKGGGKFIVPLPNFKIINSTGKC